MASENSLMNAPRLQPFRPPVPGVAEPAATCVQLLSELIAPQVARWKSKPAFVSIPTVVPSIVVPAAFFSVYVSLPLICGIVSAVLMMPTLPAASYALDVSKCAPLALPVVPQLQLYGDVVSVLCSAPSR